MRHSKVQSSHAHEPPPSRLRHGDVRAALLVALSEGPAHGYELGQRLLRASGGAWQPSPGSIYPTLQALAEEGLATSEERDQKRIYTITRRGLARLRERSERGEPLPWQAAHDAHAGELREAVQALRLAAKQVSTVGDGALRARATAIVNGARRQLYELLAEA
ncbi:MAG TPA: PadR family transcriptional regulator [Polyangiales bacterium]|jgi:DNA-binding PadR family transcriptional regulator